VKIQSLVPHYLKKKKYCRDFVEIPDTSNQNDVRAYFLAKMYGKLFKPVDLPVEIKKTIYEVFYEFQMGDSTFTSKAGSADTHLGDRASCPALITSLKALVTAVEHDWVLNSFTSEFPKSAGIRAMIAAIGEWPTGRDAVLG